MLGVAAGTGKRIVQSVWDSIQPDWRPTILTPYGCGHYGCVYPTQNPEIVLKVTTDPTEAAFVQIAQTLGFPDGIVKYYRIEATAATYRGRTAYLIWRESAYEVGDVFGGIVAITRDADPYLRRTALEASKYLSMFQGYAGLIRNSIIKSSDPVALQVAAAQFADWAWNEINWEDSVSRIKQYRGPQRLAAAERAALGTAQMLGSTYLFDEVGQALEYYLNRGLLLADVHGGNIGRVRREDYGEEGLIVVTDPGHLVDLRPYYQAAGKF